LKALHPRTRPTRKHQTCGGHPELRTTIHLANLGGFDLTAVAKTGIDRVVAEAKNNHVPVVYRVSKD